MNLGMMFICIGVRYVLVRFSVDHFFKSCLYVSQKNTSQKIVRCSSFIDNS
jgi:hypothetical protein